MAPLNIHTNTNSATVPPVRVTDEDLQGRRYRLQTPERFKPLNISHSPPLTCPLSSPPSPSPLRNPDAASTAQRALLPLSSYLINTPSADKLLTLDWKDLTNDTLLAAAAEYTTDEMLKEVNRVRGEATPAPCPITKRQAQQKITSCLNSVAKRNGIGRSDLKAALQRARGESGCLARMNRGGNGEGGEGEGVGPREGMPGQVKKFRMVIDRAPARKWEKGTVGVRSLTGVDWESQSWERR